MHTFNSKGVTFHYNQDLSGMVEIFVPKEGSKVSVRGEALLEFVAEYIRTERMTKLEDASTHELLGVTP